VVGLAALQERVITQEKTYFCPGHYKLGNQTFYCHQRHGHGQVNLKRAIMKSCDVFFYQVASELGVDRIAKYAKAFGLGQKLGVELNAERPGLVPTSQWKLETVKVPWAAGDTPNIGIGQGYNLMTPMQMATTYAAIANGGKIFRPHLVRRVTNRVGEAVLTVQPELISKVESVSQANFDIMRAALQSVVMDDEGTGKSARVEGHTVAGKTGSVQVVSLAKNRNQSDVSMKWKEHALFAAFSPVEAPEVTVVVVSENDSVGGGGRSAAPIAQQIIAAYWKFKEERERGGGPVVSRSEKENGSDTRTE
jgi:penicillin-binding protein 2